MLRSIAVERYRCFASRATLDLRPLTVLFGKNSAGKSALLRAVPLAAASCAGGGVNRTGPLALEHPASMGARYTDIRTHLTARNDVGLCLTWSRGSVREVDIGLRDMTAMAGPPRQVVERFAVRNDSGREVLHAELDPETDRVLVSGSKPVSLIFEGLVPQSSQTKGAMYRVVNACREQMAAFSRSVDWLAPVRVSPPRARVQRLETATLGPFGERVTEVLAQPSATDLLSRVKETVQSVLRLDLELDKDAGDLALAFRSGPRLTHVLDVGSGIPQTLPVLVRLAEVALGRANGRIVAIEQPEAHLHADAEVKLAEVIVASISAQRRAADCSSVILETHSENLFLSLQLAVLQKRLLPEDIVVYWLSQADDGSVVPARHEIDAMGVVTPPWPPGVFSEDMVLARSIVQARQQARQRGE
jgi:AAA ATPase domain